MKILMINKFLYPNGGSETYIFKLGNYLKEKGHEVQYFGMEHEGRCVGNKINAYTSDMDFHTASKLKKLTYPLKTIYSIEARKKIRLVLEDFNPDVCHLNNFNYQLTPSIILEIRKFEKERNKKIKIIFTAHDSQLVCPNHLMQNPLTKKPCNKCLTGNFINCIYGKCIHGSTIKSTIGAIEAYFWKIKKIYKELDCIISPSYFLAEKLSKNLLLKNKIKVLHNFIDNKEENTNITKEDYILYFGRFSLEKGIGTLLKVCEELSNINFIFAGSGPLENEIENIKNIKNLGFLTGKNLKNVISKAKFTVFSSECYENCPFSVMESQMYGTPVLGANIGGIPELIQIGKTGETFESGNKEELKNKILELWNDKEKIKEYSRNCRDISFDTLEEYYKKVIKIYSISK